jgi:unsaturated rhamnogalacturonyl hydrolase
MGEPFYAEYSQPFGENNWDDIANQFIWMEQHVRDDKTGLLYHAWDESKKMPWADKATGRAPMFWGRAIGWYAMAIVDVLDFLPKDHAKRPELIAILNRTTSALKKVQDKSGAWWLILDMPGAKRIISKLRRRACLPMLWRKACEWAISQFRM